MRYADRGCIQRMGVLPLLMSLLLAGCASAPEGAAVAPGPVGGPVAGPAPTTASQGVFTSAQAGRGQATFESNCSSCHGTTEFSNVSFRRFLATRSIGDLFFQISTTMPRNSPGGLAPAEYAEVLAYFLSMNGYSVGTAELSALQTVLDGIAFAPVPTP